MDELFYKLALSRTEGIGPVKFKKLLAHFGSAKDVFSSKAKHLKSLLGLTNTNARSILNFEGFNRIEYEIDYCKKNGIQILDSASENYPTRLQLCIDAPPILFYKGNANLNHAKVVSVIGTRMFTEYGRKVCEELIEGLQAHNVLVTSGLAFGVDAIAHKSCVRLGMPTVGVVAHGLDSIYPVAHRGLSNDMILNGGLLSEYFSDISAEKGNFPTRNRIVAGMADATVIIETDMKGGSMITGDIAYSYNRDVFCFPGRVKDAKSSGCNFLIKTLKAQMITEAADIAQSLGWTIPSKKIPSQRSLFVELNPNEQLIMNLLQTNPSMHIDEFYVKSVLNSSELASSLLSLEMQQVIKVMPGKIIELI